MSNGLDLVRRVGIAFVAGLFLLPAAMAAEPLIFEVASVQSDFDRRSGQPIVKIELKEKRPFTRLVAEQQVARTMQLRVNGEVILSGVIREPLYVGMIEISGPSMSEAQARIERARETGSKLEVAILD